ncbi:MAG: endonuclease III [Pseudomonadota bacterium]
MSKLPSPSKIIRPKAKTPTKKALKAFAEQVLLRFQKAMPDARCELFYITPYQLLCSVVLSAQATDKQVNKVMEPLYRAGFTPEGVVQNGEAALLNQIKSIGLAPTKAKNIVKLSESLLQNHQGQVPSTRQELEALAGVGRKTANVILGELFQEPTLAVDTHVFRVGQRLGFHHENTPEKAELKLLELIDTSYLPRAHHWLILHGRYTCKAQKPLCESCLLLDLCPKPLSPP